MRKLLASLFLTITLGMAQGAHAGPYEDGWAAFTRGDYATALSLWRPLAARGNANAQGFLGLMYGNGQGVPQDYKEAARWYGLAAAQGDANAQFNLGLLYYGGRGVVQDYKEAVKWFRLHLRRLRPSARRFASVCQSRSNSSATTLTQRSMRRRSGN